ncbi:uncharacterized protein N7473_013181 [Penicillium subrubescens]|uniref:Uncharacterized protein n=1 Tax=Penicillium subrubescens TaxID=1316194 RepID=A0A1Q5ST03_9EURO|nr:uncharacterized protein N7473_013181 [Penicillium subrubescens]KAJ5873622.1 hypothetical protein N7473_013181 [Penicillium subrubescens]OKO91120.1 hypothetical protein PENSUB_13109 [Penicillium subrubescens]
MSTSQYQNACHQRFNTEREARGFIEDWNDAYADAWRWEIRKGLHDGWKAKSLKFDPESALAKMGSEGDTVESPIMNLKGLNLEKEPKE